MVTRETSVEVKLDRVGRREEVRVEVRFRRLNRLQYLMLMRDNRRLEEEVGVGVVVQGRGKVSLPITSSGVV